MVSWQYMPGVQIYGLLWCYGRQTMIEIEGKIKWHVVCSM